MATWDLGKGRQNSTANCTSSSNVPSELLPLLPGGAQALARGSAHLQYCWTTLEAAAPPGRGGDPQGESRSWEGGRELGCSCGEQSSDADGRGRPRSQEVPLAYASEPGATCQRSFQGSAEQRGTEQSCRAGKRQKWTEPTQWQQMDLWTLVAGREAATQHALAPASASQDW